jgi:hypothetical protein
MDWEAYSKKNVVLENKPECEGMGISTLQPFSCHWEHFKPDFE